MLAPRKFDREAWRLALFSLLALVLSCVPVFQATHALTHVDPIGTADIAPGHVTPDQNDIDNICVECLALTALSVILPGSPVFIFGLAPGQAARLAKSGPALARLLHSYFTRGPPSVFSRAA